MTIPAPEADESELKSHANSQPSQMAQYAADCDEFAADQRQGRLTEMPADYWDAMATFFRALTRAHPIGDTLAAEAVAWLHTMHMDGGQTKHSLTLRPTRAPFGIRGTDYGAAYSVTSEPLFVHPAPPAALADGLVERLKEWAKGCGNEEIMQHWDGWRKHIKDGGGASWPRDAFESLLDSFGTDAEDAAAALSQLRERLAAVERERDGERIVAEYAESANATLQADFNDCNSERARWKDRAEAAEAKLATVERERDAVQAEWYGAFTDRVVAEHGTTIDILSKRLNEYAERIAASERERDEAEDDGARMLNAERKWHAETSKACVELALRLRASEAKVLALRGLLMEARNEIDHYADTAREHDLVARIDTALAAPPEGL